MLGIAPLALSADCRSRAVESGRGCAYFGGYGLALGVTLGEGATSRGRVVSLRHAANMGSPTTIQDASAAEHRVIIAFSS